METTTTVSICVALNICLLLSFDQYNYIIYCIATEAGSLLVEYTDNVLFYISFFVNK